MSQRTVRMSLQRRELIHRALALHFMLQLSLEDDAEERLTARGIGRVHHRILYIAHRAPGITVSELLSVLNVRHQNIQKILRELVKQGYILARQSGSDGRIRHLHSSRKGDRLLQFVCAGQFQRIGRAYDRVSSQDMEGHFRLMAAMLGPERRAWADRLSRLIRQ
jgi:DNA-binding MarR family transcriptional regulator